MKIPSIVRKFRKLSIYLITYSILVMVILTPVPSIYAESQNFITRNDDSSRNISYSIEKASSKEVQDSSIK
ncbi:MAG: hypothetical protein ACTSX6_10810, partial [Candidatus Heimdallarchaeaceae archaeon]